MKRAKRSISNACCDVTGRVPVKLSKSSAIAVRSADFKQTGGALTAAVSHVECALPALGQTGSRGGDDYGISHGGSLLPQPAHHVGQTRHFAMNFVLPVSYTHLRAHETGRNLV